MNSVEAVDSVAGEREHTPVQEEPPGAETLAALMEPTLQTFHVELPEAAEVWKTAMETLSKQAIEIHRAYFKLEMELKMKDDAMKAVEKGAKEALKNKDAELKRKDEALKNKDEELKIKNEDNKKMKTLLGKLIEERELDEVDQKMTDRKAKKLEEKVAQMKKDREVTENKLVETKNELVETKNELVETKNELVETKKKMKKLEEDLEEKEYKLVEAKNETKKVTEEGELFQKAITTSALLPNIAAAEKRNAILKKEEEALQKKIADAQEELKSIETKCEQAKQETAAAEEQKKKTQLELTNNLEQAKNSSLVMLTLQGQAGESLRQIGVMKTLMAGGMSPWAAAQAAVQGPPEPVEKRPRMDPVSFNTPIFPLPYNSFPDQNQLNESSASSREAT